MRRGFGILGLVLTLVLISVVGVIAYNAGWSSGFGQHLPEAGSTAAPAAGYYPYYYGYGPHFFGFGWIFGLLFFLFIIWIFFRVIFGFGRWGRGWGYYKGMGGMGSGHHGGGIPPAIDERMREWHTRVHSGQAGAETSSPPPPPPPPPAATA